MIPENYNYNSPEARKAQHEIELKLVKIMFIILGLVCLGFLIIYLYLFFFGSCQQLANSFDTLAEIPARCGNFLL